jgi:hypothetical protein
MTYMATISRVLPIKAQKCKITLTRAKIQAKHQEESKKKLLTVKSLHISLEFQKYKVRR